MGGWIIPKIWQDGEVFIIGGGPSILRQFNIPQEIIVQVMAKRQSPSVYSPYLEPLHDKHVIGVNAAYKLGDWIDMIVFGDKKWYLENQKELARFPNLKVSCHGHIHTKKCQAEGIKYVAKDTSVVWGLSSRPGYIGWNGHSGALAINMAINAGARRVILLGYDMKLNESNKQHWHALYRSAERTDFDPRRLPFERHMNSFPQIAIDAKRMGVEIINANPDSAIEEFKKIDIHELL